MREMHELFLLPASHRQKKTIHPLCDLPPGLRPLRASTSPYSTEGRLYEPEAYGPVGEHREYFIYFFSAGSFVSLLAP